MAKRKSPGGRRLPASIPEPSPSRATPSGSTRVVAAILGVILFVIYLSNVRERSSADNIPTRLLPFSLLREGNLDLDEFEWLRGDGKLPYYVRESGGRLYSGSPVVTSILVTPLYAVPAWLLSARSMSYDEVRVRLLIVAMERISAAALTALSASLLFACLCRLGDRRWALGLALTYALGTNTWAVSSQGLWTHTLSELGLAMLSLVLLRPNPSAAALAVAGTTIGAVVANRPPMLIFALLASVFLWQHHRRRLIAFLTGPTTIACLALAYNFRLFASLVGPYQTLDHFGTPLPTGLAGLLVSPNRGLFVYTPIMLFAVWGALRVWRESAPPWVRYLVVGVAGHCVLYAKFNEWWAGYAFGPRYMTDILPALTLLLAFGLVPLCRTYARTAAVTLLALYGVGVQIVGVYYADDAWNRLPVTLEEQPERVWDWSDWQVTRAVRSGWKGDELLSNLLGVLRDPLPVRVQPLSANDLANEIIVLEAPSRLAAGGRADIVVEVINRGGHPWPAFTGDVRIRDTVFVVARWLQEGRIIPWTGDVFRLPENVAPGEGSRMRVPLAAPATPGGYEIEFLIMQAIDGLHGLESWEMKRIPVQID